MKKVLMALMSVALLGGMSSCNKWLDVDADTRIGENVIFENCEGMRIALNGIYQHLASKQLYGQELSYGLNSAMGREYKFNNLSSQYKYLLFYYEMWNDSYTTKLIDPIWSKYYNILANVNNLLQAVESKDESFFEWGKLEKDIFVAELHGLRGFIHFDLLRMFAPAPIKDDGGKYIPYVEKYPDYQPVKLTVKETIKKIEDDLMVAHNLLMPQDTAVVNTNEIIGHYGIYTASYRFGTSSGSSLLQGQWFGRRGTRMNFYAATALLMRLYMWDQKPEKADALGHYFLHKKWFTPYGTTSYSWTTKSNVKTPRHRIHRKLYDDILMATYNTNIGEWYKTFHGTSTTKYNYYDSKFFNELYEEDPDDFRKELVEDDWASSRWTWSDQTSDYTTRTINENQMPLSPVIRTSEVMLMLCEIWAEKDLAKAIDLMQTFRKRRGALRTLDTSMTKEDFLHLVELEWAREFQSDGQRFFYYKRLAKPVFQGKSEDRYDFNLLENGWVYPTPIAESSYTL